MRDLSFLLKMIKKRCKSYLRLPAVNIIQDDTQRDLLAHGCPDLFDPKFKMPQQHFNAIQKIIPRQISNANTYYYLSRLEL